MLNVSHILEVGAAGVGRSIRILSVLQDYLDHGCHDDDHAGGHGDDAAADAAAAADDDHDDDDDDDGADYDHDDRCC